MKLNRPAVLVSISLLTLGGLYYGFFRPGSEGADPQQVRHEPKAAPVLSRPAENAGVTTPSFPEKRPPEVVEPEAANAGVRAGPSGSPVKPGALPAAPAVRAITAARQTGRPAPAPADHEDPPARPAMGIRLAPDVRLPVAALPNDLNLNPIRQKALQHIIDEYYQTVAATVPARGSDGGGTPVAQGNGGKASDSPTDLAQTTAVQENGVDAPAGQAQPPVTTVVEENGEETVMIHNSPQVDAARERADLRFKALFGNAAYTRMTMNALLESRLPPVKTEP